jgi:hypothetical protein
MYTYILLLTITLGNGDQYVHVLDHNLTGEDCIQALEDRYQPDDHIGRLSCEVDTMGMGIAK